MHIYIYSFLFLWDIYVFPCDMCISLWDKHVDKCRPPLWGGFPLPLGVGGRTPHVHQNLSPPQGGLGRAILSKSGCRGCLKGHDELHAG